MKSLMIVAPGVMLTFVFMGTNIAAHWLFLDAGCSDKTDCSIVNMHLFIEALRCNAVIFLFYIIEDVEDAEWHMFLSTSYTLVTILLLLAVSWFVLEEDRGNLAGLFAFHTGVSMCLFGWATRVMGKAEMQRDTDWRRDNRVMLLGLFLHAIAVTICYIMVRGDTPVGRHG